MQPTHHVLAHIEQDIAIGHFGNRNGFQLLHYTDILVGLSDQFTTRSRQHLCCHPFVIGLISRTIPTRHLIVGFVLFAVELIVGNDRTARCCLPCSICHHQLLGSILILQLQLSQQTRNTKTTCTRITHREETAITQYHTDRIIT